jgi:hypothetical protein
MKNRILFLGLAMFLSVASAWSQGGTTGPLTWNLSGSGNNRTLTISGNGDMPDYFMDMPGGKAPWYDYRLSIKTVVIETGVTSTGKWAFFNHIFTSISLPSSLISIGENTFEECKNLTSIIIPNSVTKIGSHAFSDCITLVSIILSNNLTAIGSYAFYRTSITSITLPSSVTTIGDYAFRGCTELTLVTNLKPIPIAISFKVFEGMNISVCELRVPADEISRYQNADVWKSFYIVGCYLVKVTANNDEYGFVFGDDFYKANTTVTVTATANSGYHFVNWTKNATEVSKDNPYIFNVTEDMELVANFEEKTAIEPIETAVISIYPNPTTGEFKVTGNELQVTNVEVFDVLGKKVFEQKENLTILSPPLLPQRRGEYDLTVLSPGIYFIRIQTETGVITRKVIKN